MNWPIADRRVMIPETIAGRILAPVASRFQTGEFHYQTLR